MFIKRNYAPDDPGDGAPAPAQGQGQNEPKPQVPEPKEPDPNAAFLEELNKLASQITNTQVMAGAAPGEPAPAPAPTPKGEPAATVPKGDAFQEFIQDPEKFSSYVQGVVKQAKEEAKNEILKTIPSELKKVVKEEISFDRAANEFWIENPDLIPARPFLAARASLIAAQSPDLTYNEVFKKAGKEVRESLQKMGVKLTTEGMVRRPGARAQEPGSPADKENDVKSIALKKLKL